MNRIVASAVRYNGITFSMPAPARHSDILRPLYDLSETTAICCEQGFLTDTGEFLGRIGAKQLVKDMSQPTIRDTHRTELFSEDLW
ncbi:p063 [Rhizobium phage 16-3]|uniref:p063 n=1 Tax=Rhizobium phage 16-3 TaxID=10704 RepID=UPI00017BA610|nr:p063 [Rhizobium phage 16-3]ABF71317.1 p063 [Rhizobium phage 16-3]